MRLPTVYKIKEQIYTKVVWNNTEYYAVLYIADLFADEQFVISNEPKNWRDDKVLSSESATPNRSMDFDLE